MQRIAFSFLFVVGLLNTPLLFSQGRSTYIEEWKDVAMQNMLDYKIPASITLAQGILESGNGKSELAKRANNHFGIKCHNWDGPRVYHDDDARGECFRKYRNAQSSYDDHSEFLASQPRYRSLFDLKVNDYKGWAKGLKKAGYATNPKYPKLLITIIEEEGLARYDEMVVKGKFNGVSRPNDHGDGVENQVIEEEDGERVIQLTREVLVHPNQINFVKTKEGETLEDIALEFNLGPWQLRKYNDLDGNPTFEEGQELFLQPKRRKAKEESHVVQAGESLRSISQRYGVKMRRIRKMNNQKKNPSWEPKEGDTLVLR